MRSRISQMDESRYLGHNIFLLVSKPATKAVRTIPNDTRMLMSTFKHSQSSSQSQPSNIAIIGGGFAGLTLANYLVSKERPNTTNCQVVVLEAKEAPIPIIGTIRLPVAATIIKELNLDWVEDATAESLSQSVSPVHSLSNDYLVDRPLFLNQLRKRIAIQYSCRVERIETISMESSDNQHSHNHSKKKYLVWDEQGHKYGPYDLVIAANGLCLKSVPWFPQVSAVVGDVRWQYDTWFWDFGRQRIQRGGNIALEDARELAQAIITGMSTGLTADSWSLHIPIKFQPKHHHHRHRWHTSRLVFLSIVVAFLCRMILTIERI